MPRIDAQILAGSITNKDILEELEIVFSFIPDAPDVAEEKQKLALVLFIAYRDGVDDSVARNEVKADYYLGAAYFLPQTTSDSVVTFFSWFTTVRLGLLRTRRQYNTLVPALPADRLFVSDNGFLPSYFQIFSLSYFLEFVYCIGKVFYDGFRPETKEDKRERVSLWKRWDTKRFKQGLTKDFWSTLTNAIIWMIVNIVPYIPGLGGSVSVTAYVFNVVGFFLDLPHDVYFAYCELTTCQAVTKIRGKPSCSYLSENIISKAEKAANEKIASAREKVARQAIIAIGIFIGMCVFYCPLLLPAIGVKLTGVAITFGKLDFLRKILSGFTGVDFAKKVLEGIGSIIVMLFGFCYGGLGGRLWRTDKTYLAAFAINLLLFIGLPILIPSLGAAMLSLGSATLGMFAIIPLTFLATCFVTVKIINAIKNPVTTQTPPPISTEPSFAIPLSSTSALLKRINTLEEYKVNGGKAPAPSRKEKVIDINAWKIYSKEEMGQLQKASGLNDKDWLRNLRNVSLAPQQRETKLSKSFYRFLGKTVQPSGSVGSRCSSPSTSPR